MVRSTLKLAERPFILILFLGLFVSCVDIDRAFFSGYGGTLSTSPKELIIKDLHFRTKEVLGQSVVFTGKIIKLSEHGTFAIVEDESAKMLISLVRIKDELSCCLTAGSTFKVLGSVELTAAGHVFVTAHAFYPQI
jgi:hypothetical protein